MAKVEKTVERINPEDFQSKEEYLIYLRHLIPYNFAKNKISKDSFVLEAGCGEGYGTNILKDSVKEIIGIDVDEEVIEKAKKKYGGDNCSFAVYDGEKIPHKENTFDLVVSFQVIEHVLEDENYIAEIHRVLKRGGTFLISTPNRVYRLKDGEKPWNKFHVREYHNHEIEAILESRFSNVSVWGIRGTEEAQRIEVERVKQGAFMKFLNKNHHLRKLFPDFLKKMVLSFVNRNKKEDENKEVDKSFLEKYSVNDFYIIKDGIEDSLDIFAVCKK